MRLAPQPASGATLMRLQVRARRERGAVRRRARRSGEAGFTLIELMVVVVLVSILALLATPVMRTSRDDRVAFDLARKIEQLWTRTQTRAAGHGAHLFVAAPSGGTRGKFLLFEAFDNTAPPLGPAPLQGCKGATQWNAVSAWLPGSVSGFIKFIDGFDQATTAGVTIDADIRTAFDIGGVATPAFVMCVSGSTIYVGRGGTIALAIADMGTQILPFSGTAQIIVSRNRLGAPIGLQRFVRKSGNGTALVFSR